MSVLEIHGRPFTVFDPSNEQHRSFYNDFVRHGTWGRCPYRFVVPDDQGNLVTLIQRKLVEFYVKQEFETVAKKPRKRPVAA
jgi:hypothetical protein